MKFDELDKKMRVYETIHDYCFLPDIFIVARLDGRNFTSLTRKKHPFEAPFDETFRDYMIETVKHIMNCGFSFTYGYTQSDEISLLFSQKETAFARKERKYNSILAGEASAKFSICLGEPVCFDCRISELPTKETVIDYFRWRNEDASRNALNSYCYWTMRKQGKTKNEATHYFEKMSIADKNEYLFQNGINFNNIPLWQKRGIGFYYESYQTEGHHPILNEIMTKEKRKIKVDFSLPIKEKYASFIEHLII